MTGGIGETQERAKRFEAEQPFPAFQAAGIVPEPQTTACTASTPARCTSDVDALGGCPGSRAPSPGYQNISAGPGGPRLLARVRSPPANPIRWAEQR
jgi:hypothetical protein